MAACYSAREVLELLDEEEIENNDDEEEEENVDVDDKFRTWLDSFPAPDNFNSLLFKDLAREVLKPVIDQCSVSCNDDDLPAAERSKAATLLSQTSVNAASLLHSEAALWLDKISKRLAGRVAVRCPYSATISRHIPYEVFKVARRAIEHAKDVMFLEPKCYIKRNSKAEVIAFTSSYSFQKFMSMIAGISRGEVKKYFSRTIRGKTRVGHVVKLLVEEESQLALTYHVKRGQLDITFKYGEWNTQGYPLHNCKFDPEQFL